MWVANDVFIGIAGTIILGVGWKMGQKSEAYGCVLPIVLGAAMLLGAAVSEAVRYFVQ